MFLCVYIQCMLQWMLCNTFFNTLRVWLPRKCEGNIRRKGNNGAFEHFWLIDQKGNPFHIIKSYIFCFIWFMKVSFFFFVSLLYVFPIINA